MIPLKYGYTTSIAFYKLWIFNKIKEWNTVIIMSVNLQGLQMCRILKSAGHRVILADLHKFRFSAARFSNSVDKWVTLSDLDGGLESEENYKVTGWSESGIKRLYLKVTNWPQMGQSTAKYEV